MPAKPLSGLHGVPLAPRGGRQARQALEQAPEGHAVAITHRLGHIGHAQAPAFKQRLGASQAQGLLVLEWA